MIFNAYDVGPYSSGPYEVDIPYDRLKPVLRADGPIAALAAAPLPAPVVAWPASRGAGWSEGRLRQGGDGDRADDLRQARAFRRRPQDGGGLCGAGRQARGAAKDHLLADQVRWLANRAVACVGEPAEIEECLETRYRDRTAQLEWLADGAYPFISEQAIVKIGKVRGIPYIIDASYPQFDARHARLQRREPPACGGDKRGRRSGHPRPRCRQRRRQLQRAGLGL